MNISDLIVQYGVYALLLVAANLFLALQLVRFAAVYAGRKTAEAMGARGKNKSLHSRCAMLVRQSIKQYEKRKKKAGLYEKAADKMRRSGYSGQYAPALYLLLKYVATTVLFIYAFILNYPNILPAFAVSIGPFSIIEMVIASNRRKINLKLQKYMYKIYKYLHNQISSGVRVADAIRTVYEVIDDSKLRNILVKLAAFYDLTLDIDKALEEFSLNFNAHEAETLCVVLKQGIETGDNQDLLARQEDVMFKKYFNYIQAETDNCKTRCLMAAVMYTAVVVIMIIIPLLNDTAEAVGKIFIN